MSQARRESQLTTLHPRGVKVENKKKELTSRLFFQEVSGEFYASILPLPV
jgi:hypothetical protein